MNRIEFSLSGKLLQRVADHVGVEVAAAAGINLNLGTPVARIRSASIEVSWSPSIPRGSR